MVTAAERNRQWRKDNPEKQMLRGVKKRVREKGYAMDIDLSDITIPNTCPILNIPLILGGGDNAPTLDRINNSRGYVKGNVHVISYRANRFKSDGTLEEMILLGKWAESEISRSK